MILYVSGATATLRRLGHPRRLGHLLTPNTFNNPSTLMATGRPIAADNAAFSGFDFKTFCAMAWRLNDLGCMYDWLTVPDLVGDAYGTLYLWLSYIDMLTDADPDTHPLAFVGQDGAEDLDLDEVWSLAACWFIGGTTAWKLSATAADLAAEARRRGLWVHMGRVNSKRRLEYAYQIGCDSIDGSGCSKWPDTRIPLFLRWMREIETYRNLFAERDP